jgi:hypothetical protein
LIIERGSSRNENTMGLPRGASLTTLFDMDVATIDRWKGKHPEVCGP